MKTNKNIQIVVIAIGLILLFISQLLLSFGYDFLMAQKPIDFAHWSMLLASIFLFGLWFVIPDNLTKRFGLVLMTIGIAGIIGMCCIDFILWASHENQELKGQIFTLISENKSINYPFLIIGPTLFYMGMGISTYGLFTRYKWQVATLNVGLLFIGLGHLIFQNRIIPVIGSVLLLIGIMNIVLNNTKIDKI